MRNSDSIKVASKKKHRSVNTHGPINNIPALVQKWLGAYTVLGNEYDVTEANIKTVGNGSSKLIANEVPYRMWLTPIDNCLQSNHIKN